MTDIRIKFTREEVETILRNHIREKYRIDLKGIIEWNEWNEVDLGAFMVIVSYPPDLKEKVRPELFVIEPYPTQEQN